MGSPPWKRNSQGLGLRPFQAPTDSLQKNKRSSGDAVVFSTVKDFFQAPYVPQNSPNVSTLPAGRRFVTPEREEGARPSVGPDRAAPKEPERGRVTRREVRPAQNHQLDSQSKNPRLFNHLKGLT